MQSGWVVVLVVSVQRFLTTLLMSASSYLPHILAYLSYMCMSTNLTVALVWHLMDIFVTGTYIVIAWEINVVFCFFLILHADICSNARSICRLKSYCSGALK